jgi:prophage maintenance system killer protein/prophage antirepressor-like protein
MKKEIIIYQSKQGGIEFKGDLQRETLWASQAQIVSLFDVDQSVVSRHIRNIFKDGEIKEKSNMQKMHIANSDKPVVFYSLDVILAVGYRTNSRVAIEFRKWTTKILRQHILKGYTINKKRIAKNYEEFLQAVEIVKTLLPVSGQIGAEDSLELVKMFAKTWLSLDAYDKSSLPKSGTIKKQVKITAEELVEAITGLKQNLQKKNEEEKFFAQEKQKEAIAGIVGNIFQSVFNRDVYGTLEEKAAHLLYFFVKDHPFIDGNKRSGAFSFIWFLNKTGMFRKDRITPEALTALTLLVAESDPKDKGKMISLILQLLKK